MQTAAGVQSQRYDDTMRHRLTARMKAVEMGPATHVKKEMEGISWNFLTFILGCFALVWLFYKRSIGASLSISDSGRHSCIEGFRTYRNPLHHEGLPQLIEVFATNNAVYFVALNKGVCDPEWGDGAQVFAGQQFRCTFLDKFDVLSDPVHPIKQWDIYTQAIMMIRCSIPEVLQDWLPSLIGTTYTRLTVTLEGTVDLEKERGNQDNWTIPSSHQVGRYMDLPVCPREWPQQLDSSPPPSLQPSRRTISMVTQILMEYETFEADNRSTVQIPQTQILTWIEYHRMLGFEHFYIFDNDPKQHGQLEQLMRPYVQESIVTYVWYPVKDCVHTLDGELKGSRMTISQALSSTAALRRYSHHTEFMGHFDVDEFIQLPAGVTNMKNLLARMPSNVTTLVHKQEWFHDCDIQSNSKTASSVSMEKEYCVAEDSTPVKSIMRTDDILAFFVHAPWVKTNNQLVDWDSDTMEVDGLTIAHIRTQRARDVLPPTLLRKQHLIPDSEQLQSLQNAVNNRLKQFPQV